VASGLCPHFSIDDTYLMAQLAVDEAVRNLLCHGTDPEKIALVDNFCWPDPTPSARNPDAEFKLAQLVRCCMGLKTMVETYGMPLVSGKDSMKNDYHGEKLKISVLPTLLVTAMGHVPDVTRVPKSQASAGQMLYRLGLKDYDQYFGHFLHNVTDIPRRNQRQFNWARIRGLYSKLHQATKNGLISSLHDISEGGMLVAIFETLLMDKLGVKLNPGKGVDMTAWLYSELPGHFVVAVNADKCAAFEAQFAPDEWELLGTADQSGVIEVDGTSLSMHELAAAWRQS
jgi:phosphoribosylformylglycinamidine synthase